MCTAESVRGVAAPQAAQRCRSDGYAGATLPLRAVRAGATRRCRSACLNRKIPFIQLECGVKFLMNSTGSFARRESSGRHRLRRRDRWRRHWVLCDDSPAETH
ncbi:unnamed protein product, partial [Iphiclides podalirius]